MCRYLDFFFIRRRYFRLPRPAIIAATPRPIAVPSWSPAVPPPPVWGAPLGKEVADAGLVGGGVAT
ncbi:MAG: hypothetical protein ACRDN0_35510 [Trebonia sp.]